MAYKTPNTPYNPTLPRERAGNYVARKTRKPFFDSDVKTSNYEFDIGKYLKSYIIIPICYQNMIYGNLVLCYKKKHVFKEEDLGVAETLGNTTAQAITIKRLVKSEQDAILAKKKHLEREQALKTEKLKAEFISDATHELRTPLAIIRGNVDLALMKKSNNPKSALASLRAINEEIKHLGSILSDLTLLTSDEIELKRRVTSQVIDLGFLINSIVKRCKVFSDKKNIKIQINKMPRMLMKGDAVYIERLFLNLIKNAISYSRENGLIKISGSIKKDQVVVSVEDRGIGISAKDLPHIFERFYRSERARAVKKKGSTGLGLAISKWIVEAHKGLIQVKSSENKGSIFTVIFPTHKSD